MRFRAPPDKPGAGKMFASREAWLKYCANEVTYKNSGNPYTTIEWGDHYIGDKMLGKCRVERKRNSSNCKRWS